MKGLSVRDVMTFGYETFPNAPRDWPTVEVSPGLLTIPIVEMIVWCNQQIGHTDWARDGSRFYFTRAEDALLFRLAWVEGT
jgi:hypothetical protein